MKFLPFVLALSCVPLSAAPLTIFANGKIVTVDAAFSPMRWRWMANASSRSALEVGKRADFIILDRDVLKCPLDDLKTTQVRETWLDGKQIRAAAGK